MERQRGSRKPTGRGSWFDDDDFDVQRVQDFTRSINKLQKEFKQLKKYQKGLTKDFLLKQTIFKILPKQIQNSNLALKKLYKTQATATLAMAKGLENFGKAGRYVFQLPTKQIKNLNEEITDLSDTLLKSVTKDQSLFMQKQIKRRQRNLKRRTRIDTDAYKTEVQSIAELKERLKISSIISQTEKQAMQQALNFAKPTLSALQKKGQLLEQVSANLQPTIEKMQKFGSKANDVKDSIFGFLEVIPGMKQFGKSIDFSGIMEKGRISLAQYYKAQTDAVAKGTKGLTALKVTGTKVFAVLFSKVVILTGGIALLAAGAVGLFAIFLKGFQAWKSYIGELISFRRQAGITKSMLTDVQFDRLRKSAGDIAYEGEKYAQAILTQYQSLKDVRGSLDQAGKSVFHMNKMLNMTADQAAKAQYAFRTIHGITGETLDNLTLSIRAMAEFAGVIPKEIMEDIASASDDVLIMLGKSPQHLARSAVLARRLYMTMSDIASMVEKSWDVESEITKAAALYNMTFGAFDYDPILAFKLSEKPLELLQYKIQQALNIASKGLSELHPMLRKDILDMLDMDMSQISKLSQLGIQDVRKLLAQTQDVEQFHQMIAEIMPEDVYDQFELFNRKMEQFTLNMFKPLFDFLFYKKPGQKTVIDRLGDGLLRLGDFLTKNVVIPLVSWLQKIDFHKIGHKIIDTFKLMYQVSKDMYPLIKKLAIYIKNDLYPKIKQFFEDFEEVHLPKIKQTVENIFHTILEVLHYMDIAYVITKSIFNIIIDSLIFIGRLFIETFNLVKSVAQVVDGALRWVWSLLTGFSMIITGDILGGINHIRDQSIKFFNIFSKSLSDAFRASFNIVIDTFQFVGNVCQSILDIFAKIFEFTDTAKTIKQFTGNLFVGAKDFVGNLFSKPLQLAQGGVVDKPTLALIGQGREPQIVLPLSKLEKIMQQVSSKILTYGSYRSPKLTQQPMIIPSGLPLKLLYQPIKSQREERKFKDDQSKLHNKIDKLIQLMQKIIQLPINIDLQIDGKKMATALADRSMKGMS